MTTYISTEAPLLFVAPFPHEDEVAEGWLSRIRSIDHLFRDRKRTYVTFSNRKLPANSIESQKVAPLVTEAKLNLQEPSHRQMFDSLVSAAAFVYVHTVHLLADILPWLICGKVVVDIHGIVPEEELMLGSPDRAEMYAPVEEAAVRQASLLVVVSESMKHHLKGKYPFLGKNVLVLPIIEVYQDAMLRKTEDVMPDDGPFNVVYAGGIQPWQNVDLMVSVAKRCEEFASFSFVSRELHVLADRAQANGAIRNTSFRRASKAELPGIYADHQFGLVLRDDCAVNRVSCPTKLSEYLDFGLIPIVKSPYLGDFAEAGYCYLTYEEFCQGFVPDRQSRKEMRFKNYAVIDNIRRKHNEAAHDLHRRFLSEIRVGTTHHDLGAKYSCAERFASAVGLPADKMIQAFEIERVFHQRLLSEASPLARRSLYERVYKQVFEIYGFDFELDITQQSSPKDSTVATLIQELRGASILDVGCGKGDFLLSCARLVKPKKLVGVDVFVRNLKIPEKRLQFVQDDIVDFDLGEEFDVVMSDNVFEHIASQDTESFLSSLYRAMRPGGTLILLTPNRLFGPWDVTRILDDSYSGKTAAQGTHVNETTYGELLALLSQQGFRRFRTIDPRARAIPRLRGRRYPARVFALIEKMTHVVKRLQTMEKRNRLQAFEICVIAERAPKKPVRLKKC